VNKFITEIIVKMKPNKPTRKSDVEVLDDLISDKFITLHKALIKQGARIMAELKDVQDAIAAEKAEVAAKIAALTATIEALEATLANGTPVTGDDLAALVAQVQGIFVADAPADEPLPAE
jgi:hypothetical protein